MSAGHWKPGAHRSRVAHHHQGLWSPRRQARHREDHRLAVCERPRILDLRTLGKAHGLHGELYLNPVPRRRVLAPRRAFLPGPSRHSSGDGHRAADACVARRVGGTDLRPLVLLDLATTRGGDTLQGRELLATVKLSTRFPIHVRRPPRPARRDCQRPSLHTGQRRRADAVARAARDRFTVGTSVLVPLVDELADLDDEAGIVRVVDGLLDEPATLGHALRRLHALSGDLRLVPGAGPHPQCRAAWRSLPVNQLPDHTPLSHLQVDDTPYGGGAGIVMRIDVVCSALEATFGQPAGSVRETRRVVELMAKDPAQRRTRRGTRPAGPRPPLRPLRRHRRRVLNVISDRISIGHTFCAAARSPRWRFSTPSPAAPRRRQQPRERAQ